MRKFQILLLALLIVLSGCSGRSEPSPSGTETVPPVSETEVPQTESTAQTQLTEPETTAPETTAPSATFPEPEPTETTQPSAPEPEPTEATQPSVPEPATGLQQVTLTLSHGRTADCWLYVPEAPGANPGLIVYLHGSSGKGDDLNLITEAGGFPQYLQSGQLGTLSSYVLIPQLPQSLKGWSDMDNGLMDMIRTVVRTYGIDTANISLTGHSMGGTGVWSIAAAHPGFFARIAPLSGSIRNTPENVQALKGTPVYAFVGTEDTIVKPESSIAFVDALTAAGGTAQIAEIEGADHFAVPECAYLGDYGLVEWLEGM